MSRARSPGYPNYSLPDAIERIRVVFDADRQNPIDRETIAKHIGYNGISGASDKAIATLVHYGLLERVGKGEMRVTQLAKDILYPEPGMSEASAVREAALNPKLFSQLKERFEVTPSPNALKSYLKRENFLDRAIGPVTSAYIETCRYVEQSSASDFPVPSDDAEPESVPKSASEHRTMAPQTISTPNPGPVSAPFPVMDGDKLIIGGGGFAIVNLPDEISENEYEDLKDWFEIMARRAKRRIYGPAPLFMTDLEEEDDNILD